MIKIKIISIGKTKEKWLLSAIAEYTKRLQKSIKIDWVLGKSDNELPGLVAAEKHFVALDVVGQSLCSSEFSKLLFREIENRGSSLTFVIGGAEGFPSSILDKATHRISFSKMTFTHQMVRLLLLEQIYRSSEIRRGSNYHK